jgi:hypothetical protein
MSREPSWLIPVALAGWAMVVCYLIQPDTWLPISGFLAVCIFLFAIILTGWATDEASEKLRAWLRQRASRQARRKARRGEPSGT